MKVSPNFSLQECTASDTAMRKGFKEQYNPSQEIIENIKKLALCILEPIREEFGSFSPTCVYRCERVNKAVKGSIYSYHLKGMACDETFKDNKKVFLWILKHLKFTELIWEYGNMNQPLWIHVAYDPNNLCQAVKVISKSGCKNYYETELYKKHKKEGLV